MKGERSFTQVKIELIRDLIRAKSAATPDEQKSIRGKLRKVGFHLNDFPFVVSVDDIDALIASGAITVREDGEAIL